jgi:hypothetical protein
MKIKSLFVAVLLMTGVVVAPASANEKPVIDSFNFSPQEIDLSDASTTVNFELIASHPSGIDSSSIILTLTNSSTNTFTTFLKPSDANSTSTKVSFKGSITIPRDINPGVYTFSTSGIKNNSSAGYQYETGAIEGRKVRALVGAESGLLVRSGGDLFLDYATFVGPSYDKASGITFLDDSKFSPINVPIWKVGETFDPLKYYEMRVPSLSLSLKSNTTDVCPTDGKILTLKKEGVCSFSVSTQKTKDYLLRNNNQTVTITSARIKPTLIIEKIPNQDVKDLGKSIEFGRFYTPTDGYIVPQSLTPSVCFASGFFVKLISGGTCKLSYQTTPNSEYSASDLYIQSFEILKDGQPVVAPTPAVTPTPTPTAKPVVKKTITCVKGTKTIKRTAVSPKCPKGYKLKKR